MHLCGISDDSSHVIANTSISLLVTNLRLWVTPSVLPQRQRCFEEELAFVATQTPDVLACLLPDATTLRLAACHVAPRRRRSPSWCTRRRPACPVRCAPYRRGVFIAVTNGPWPICRGR